MYLLEFSCKQFLLWQQFLLSSWEQIFEGIQKQNNFNQFHLHLENFSNFKCYNIYFTVSMPYFLHLYVRILLKHTWRNQVIQIFCINSNFGNTISNFFKVKLKNAKIFILMLSNLFCSEPII